VASPGCLGPGLGDGDLRVFPAVAQTEHVTAAAGRLHLSQPTITRSLGRLEHQLGVQLFDRPGHRVRLNEFGRVLIRFAERIVGQLDAAEGELARLSDPHAGPVRVGFLPSLGTWLVPDLIRSFRDLEPGAQFVLRQATAENLADMLYQGDIDLTITSPKPRWTNPQTGMYSSTNGSAWPFLLIIASPTGAG